MTLDERLTAARNEYRELVAPTTVPGPAPGADHRRPRRRTRRWSAAFLGAAAVGLIAGSLALAGDDDGGGDHVRTRPEPPTTAEHRRDVGDVEPTAPEDPRITLSPPGPYVDGQTLTVAVPEDYRVDFYNGGGVRLCATMSGPGGWPEEFCDPMSGRGDPSSNATSTTLRVPRRVFTPDGYRDCEDEAIVCRLVIRLADGGARATGRLRFTGGRPDPGVRLDVATGDRAGRIDVRPRGLRADPTWIDFLRTDPDGAANFPPFAVKVCAFTRTTTTPGPYGEYLWDHGSLDLPNPNCHWFGDGVRITADDPDAGFHVDLPTWIFGYEGYSNCAVDACFLQIDRLVVHGPSPSGGIVGGDSDAVAAAIPVDPRVPEPTLPTLRIATPPPYATGQDLTLETRGIGPEQPSIGWCDVDSPWGCGYTGTRPGPAPDQWIVTVPDNMSFCAPNRCYLEVDSQGEGMPPIATAPLPEVGSG